MSASTRYERSTQYERTRIYDKFKPQQFLIKILSRFIVVQIKQLHDLVYSVVYKIQCSPLCVLLVLKKSMVVVTQEKLFIHVYCCVPTNCCLNAVTKYIIIYL